MNCQRIFDKILQYTFGLLFFLVPLVLSPISFELFEFPKMMLVYALTIIIVASWLGKMIVLKRVVFSRTPLDLPLLIYFISSLISTIWSINPHTSWWGYYSRFNGGLLSLICYILLYYALINNIGLQVASRLLQIILASAFLVSFWGILEHFGIDAKFWVQDVQQRVFSTLGQPNWLGAYIAAIIFIPLAFIIQNKKTKYFPLYSILYTVYFFCLIFTNSKSAILAFWVGLILFIILNALKSKPTLKITLPIFTLSLIIYLLIGGKTYHYLQKAGLWINVMKSSPVATPAPLNQPGKTNQPFISESSEIRSIVWKGAIEIWKHYPLFGSGLETFGYSYYKFRPQEHNLVSEWDFLYNKAHNEFLNIFACQGIVGLLSYLSIIIAFIFWTIRNLNINHQNKSNIKKTNKTILNSKFNSEFIIHNSKFILISLFAGWLTLLITNFFGFSVVITSLLFFILPAFSFIFQCKGPAFTSKYADMRENVKAGPLHPGQSGLLIAVGLSSLLGIITLINYFLADYYFNQAQTNYLSDNLVTSLTMNEKALRLNSHEATYHAQAARTSAKLSALYYLQDATSSAQTINQLTQLAQGEIDQALRQNPVQLNFYKNKAEVYIFLSYQDPKYKQEAIEALKQASILAPTDAKIFYNLGLLYSQTDNNPKALEVLQKAVDLKPNYRPALLKLAQVYQQTGDMDQAKQILEDILKTIDNQDKDALQMLEDIKGN